MTAADRAEVTDLAERRRNRLRGEVDDDPRGRAEYSSDASEDRVVPTRRHSRRTPTGYSTFAAT